MYIWFISDSLSIFFFVRIWQKKNKISTWKKKLIILQFITDLTRFFLIEDILSLFVSVRFNGTWAQWLEHSKNDSLKCFLFRRRYFFSTFFFGNSNWAGWNSWVEGNKGKIRLVLDCFGWVSSHISSTIRLVLCVANNKITVVMHNCVDLRTSLMCRMSESQ